MQVEELLPRGIVAALLGLFVQALELREFQLFGLPGGVLQRLLIGLSGIGPLLGLMYLLRLSGAALLVPAPGDHFGEIALGLSFAPPAFGQL